MRNYFIMIFAMLLLLALTACGGEAEKAEPVPTEAVVQQEAETVPAEPEAPVAETVEATEAAEETVVTEPEADALWTANGYTLPIPEPPFAYTLKVEESDGKIDAEIHATADGNEMITHDMILEYCQAIQDAGFDVGAAGTEMGESNGRLCYEFHAGNADGSFIWLYDGGSDVAIGLQMKK